MKIINLLPKSRQHELYFDRLFHRVVKVLWFSAASFFLVIGAQLLTKIYLQNQISSIVAESDLLRSQVNKSENEQIKKTIKVNNDFITDFKNLSTIPKWSKVVEAFAKLPPPEVGITSFIINFTNKAVTINGFAPTREDVIALYNNINADTKNFYGIDYPLENVAKPTNNNFHFMFFIKDELLQ